MNKLYYLILIIFFLIIDQLSKWSVTEFLIRPSVSEEASPYGFLAWFSDVKERLPFTSLEVLPFFNIVMVWNQGISFGLFNEGSNAAPLLLSGLSVVISSIFLVWLFKTRSKLQAMAISLVIAGAIGNVIDRLRFGAVIDFLDFHAAGFHWPAFNAADSFICVGVFLLIIQSFFFEPETKSAKTKS